MELIAEAIKLAVIDGKLEEAEAIVKGLTEKYPIYE
jgi:glycine hydroxymethyltransferase